MENTTKPKIWEGKKKAFLVCDHSLRNSSAPFYAFLRKEGFTYGSYRGSISCPWAHVDITTKQYACGKIGIEVVGVIGNHAITIDEFMTIYEVFKKYEGKELFVFHKERFDYDKSTNAASETENNDL